MEPQLSDFAFTLIHAPQASRGMVGLSAPWWSSTAYIVGRLPAANTPSTCTALRPVFRSYMQLVLYISTPWYLSSSIMSRWLRPDQ